MDPDTRERPSRPDGEDASTEGERQDDGEPARFTDALESGTGAEPAPDEVAAPDFAEFSPVGSGDGERDGQVEGEAELLDASPDDSPAAQEVEPVEGEAQLLDASPDSGPLAPAQALPARGPAGAGPRPVRVPGPGEVARGRDRFPIDPQPAHPNATGAGVGSFTGARGEVALPPRFAARTKPPDFTGSGTAPPPVACPACSAQNANEALRCGRCGADIPPPITAPPVGSSVGAISPGAAIAIRVGPAEAPPAGDVLDNVPPEVREKVLAARAANTAHTAAAVRRDATRQAQIIVAMVCVTMFCGFFVSSLTGLSIAASLGVAVVDAIVFGAATWAIERSDSTPMHGMVLFGGSALFTGAVRIVLVPSPCALMGILIWSASGMMLGRFLGQHVHDRPSEGL